MIRLPLRDTLAAYLARGPLGRRGERYAAGWLRRRGHTIAARNARFGRSEADIVAIDRRTGALVIVEVKTRATASPPPELSVGRDKQRQLRRVARALRHDPRYRGRPIRFDVVAIIWPRGQRPTVRHHRGAFG